MRFVFIGLSQLTKMTARLLIGRGHEVVIVELDKEKIEGMGDDLDCSFLHGDGSKPHILQEAAPKESDVLFALTNDDRMNLLAALIGRSLGFERVVPRIFDPDLTSVCTELGLDYAIVPDMTISRYLADMAVGVDIIELSTIVKGEARYLSFVIKKEDAGPIDSLQLPEEARLICLYRDDELVFPREDTKLREGDEVVVLTHSRHLAELRERWQNHDKQ